MPGESHEDGARAAVVVGGLGEEGVDVLFYGGEEGGGDGLRHGFFLFVGGGGGGGWLFAVMV